METIELGAQSMDEEVLRLSGRGHTAEDVKEASRLIKAAGFQLILQMMTGLPGDTEEKSLETAGRSLPLRRTGCGSIPRSSCGDTALFDLWRAGLYKEHSVEDAVSVCARLRRFLRPRAFPLSGWA